MDAGLSRVIHLLAQNPREMPRMPAAARSNTAVFEAGLPLLQNEQ
jgi:hypothetical protein